MPFTKFRRFNRSNRRPRVYRKRAPVKHYKKRYVKKTAQRGKHVFPPYVLRKLTYSKISENSTTWPVINANTVFRANSLYDPELALGGGQPRYFDTLCGSDNAAAPYKKFIVLGCKVQVQGVCLSSAPVYAYVGMRNHNKGAPSSMPEVVEREDYKFKLCSNNASGPNRFSLQMYRPMNKFFGVSKKAYVDDIEDYAGDNSGDPVQQVLADIGFYNAYLGGAGGTTVSWSAKLTYYCKFFECNDVADS